MSSHSDPGEGPPTVVTLEPSQLHELTATAKLPQVGYAAANDSPLPRQNANACAPARSKHQGQAIRLPEIGETIFGFRLHFELGKGSFASVFLAQQADLAGRPVVLKVSDLEGDEPQTLAQLQHTNIVPIYSVHEDASTGQRAVCMPYLGGASLAAVLKNLDGGVLTAAAGQQLVSALETAQAPAQAAVEALHRGRNVAADPKNLAMLNGYNYVQAAAWIVARLAEGLQHSHSRGVLHRDIKPANVLIGSDGQPMLLDFNLAQNAWNSKARASLGGTVAYMAPEHLRALADRNPALKNQVDHRADIYSLGMVLFEMLIGHSPFNQSASYTPLQSLIEAMATERARTVPSLRHNRADVPWSLESIARKCLAPVAEERYEQAGQLAEDLQCFLEDRPLRYAPELSVRERCQKWTRRHPRLTSSGIVGAAATLVLLTLGTALLGARQLLAEAQGHLEDTTVHLNATQDHLARANAQDRKRAFEAGTIKALCLVNTTTGWQDHLQQGVTACEQTLGLYNILDRDDWQHQPTWQFLDREDQARFSEDIGELLLLLAWARVQSKPRDIATLQQALALLDRAEAVDPGAPQGATWEDRAFYFQQLKNTEQAAVARQKAAKALPVSARDHYLLATALARKGHYAQSVAALDKALAINPKHYWSLVQRGICHRELGDLLLAAGDFSRCVGLQPDFAWGHYNLGCVLDQSQKRMQALDSYSAAIRCDKSLALAYLNRGLAWLDLKKASLALSDLNQAAALGRDDALLHFGIGAALESLQKNADADVAFAKSFVGAKRLPENLQISLRLRYGFAVYKRLPQRAQEAFAEILVQQPHHAQALYGQAMILVENGREADALVCFEEALKWQPNFIDGRRFRAVLLARRGDLTGASQEINRCLELEPQAGSTLYAAACVLALAAAHSQPSGQTKDLEDQALAFLQKALDAGYGHDTAATDSDLRAIRTRPEFADLMASIK